MNEAFVQSELRDYATFFDTIESMPLTESQRRACVIAEDNNLVLAGAGTGKTSTMIGRAGYLIASGQARPDDILMLAFARKAAEEMQERQDTRLAAWLTEGTPTIKTFHALGLEIIGKAEGKRPDISVMAEDAHHFAQFVDECISSQCEDSNYSAMLIRYCGTERFPYRNPFDFESRQEYDEYVRVNELRTLRGEVVKSHEEVFIANFLAANGIAYEYERPYEVDTATAEFRQYRPDFYLSDYGIYIEHFALDHHGKPPKHFGNYAEGVRWKRATHREHQTRLIETHSYMKRDDVLETRLTAQLEDAGVQFHPRSPEQLLAELSQSSEITEFARLVTEFITLLKQSGTAISELRQKAALSLDASRLCLMLDLATPLFLTYEATLAERGEIDFADMISRATQHIETGQYASPYSHILVDEFQDISPARARLIRALLKQRPDAVLFAVGDDWQAIYRFTGSALGYTNRFEEVFGATATTSLDLTFRFNNKIGDAASQFVLKNPSQLRKTITSAHRVDEPAVSLVPALSARQGLDVVLETINAAAGGSAEAPLSVLVLGRFNFTVEEWSSLEHRQRMKSHLPALRIKFSTVHAAKGKEADYVVVLDVSQGKYGFPSEKLAEPVLEYLLPEREPFPFAEERRLFYVALTRARQRVYLVYNPMEASTFIRELLDEKESYPVVTDEFADRGLCTSWPQVSCPACGSGTLVKREGEYGAFVGCSHYPYCRHQERVCPGCGNLMTNSGDARVCADASCGARVPICPKCGGDLIERVGQWGRFWGCSNYRKGSGFMCTYTRKMDDRTVRRG